VADRTRDSSNVCSYICVVSRHRDSKKPEGPPSNTRVHVDLHNLWTSWWTRACRHVETTGERGNAPAALAPQKPTSEPIFADAACGRQKVVNLFDFVPVDAAC
jgi:hypothetical protein